MGGEFPHLTCSGRGVLPSSSAHPPPHVECTWGEAQHHPPVPSQWPHSCRHQSAGRARRLVHVELLPLLMAAGLQAILGASSQICHRLSVCSKGQTSFFFVDKSLLPETLLQHLSHSAVQEGLNFDLAFAERGVASETTIRSASLFESWRQKETIRSCLA